MHNEHLQAAGGGAFKTPLLSQLQSGKPAQMQTPNTLFTPFRTPGGSQQQAGSQTPLANQRGAQAGAATPSTALRDKFNINQADSQSSQDFSLAVEGGGGMEQR